MPRAQREWGQVAITQKSSSPCTVRLDRLRFSAEPRRRTKASTIKGFVVAQDFRVKPQGKLPTYSRVRKLRSRTTSSSVVVQYKAQQPWLRPCAVTVIGDDTLGITPEELERIAEQFCNCKLSLVELALDFDPSTGVDRDDVLHHWLFGKARRRADRGGPGSLRFGSRSSPKIVRCYAKSEIGNFRVELEIHGALLRGMGITDIPNLYLVASKVSPKHVRVVGVRWKTLAAHLNRRFGSKGSAMLDETRRRRDELSLRDALRFLSEQGVPNPHRFLKPLRLNDEIKVALRRWSKKFYTLVGELPTK
jgi:hypothetical protein